MPGFRIPFPNGLGCPNPGELPEAPSASIETSRVYRFAFSILAPLKPILLICHKSDRPSPEIDQITMHRGQDEMYWPGKNRWNPIEVSFYQGHLTPNTDTVCQLMYDWYGSTVVNLRESRLNERFKETCVLDLLDGRRNAVHTYKMHGCWPSKITPDSLNYSETAISEVTVRIVYDKCEENAGVGVAGADGHEQFPQQESENPLRPAGFPLSSIQLGPEPGSAPQALR